MKNILSFCLILLFPLTLYCQQNLSSDELFLKARNAAFEQKDYTTAIALAKQALEQSPNYTDISVFLGRIYTWKKDLVSARKIYADLEARNVQDEDFFVAYASLEYWNDQYKRAIEILDKGLGYNPESETLLLLKAKINYSNDNYLDAEKTVNTLLSINPKNTDARALSIKINDFISKNAIGVTYNFSHFDKQFSDNWHIIALSYKRITPIGSVILRGNYASKFGRSGTQLELEAYPKLSKILYLYVGAGYSKDVGIFPKYRTGVSLNANLPHSFEAEIGYRQLYFTNNIFLYTASVGKYYKDYWFNLRTYITPDSKNISQSYTATIRYYTKSANDYFAFQIGRGISPEDYLNNLLQNETFKLKTFKIGGEYDFSFKKTNLFSIYTMYYNQEYLPNTRGNQYDFTFGYTKKF
jgi:YaiO family outer membrane protein